MAADLKISKPRKQSKKPMDYARERLKSDDERHAKKDAEAAQTESDAAEPKPVENEGVTEAMTDQVDAGVDAADVVDAREIAGGEGEILGGTDGKGKMIPASPKVYHVGLKLIVPTKMNPRFRVDEQRVREIASTMGTPGIAQLAYPIGRKLGDGKIELLTGKHRFEAAKLLQWQTMLVDMRDITDLDAVKIVTIDNMQRTDMHPLEEAIGIENMLKAGWGLKAIAANLNKPEAWVARRHSLVKLSAKWQAAIRDPEKLDAAYSPRTEVVRNYIGRLSAKHYERVARLPVEVQESKFDELSPWFHGAMHDAEALTERLESDLRFLSNAPFSADDAEITRRLGDVSPCKQCLKQSGAAPLLFEDESETTGRGRKEKSAKCLDGGCWARKEAAFVQLRIEQARQKHGDGVIAVASSYQKPHTETNKAVKEASGRKVLPVTSIEGSFYEKQTRGTQPAIVADGARAGQTVWVKPTEKAKKSESKSTAPAKDVETDRSLHVLNAINNQLLDAKNNKKLTLGQVPDGDDLLLLAAIRICDIGWGPDRIAPAELINRLLKRKMTSGEVAMHLFKQIAFDFANEDIFKDFLESGDAVATHVLEMLEVVPGEWDLATLRANAVAEIPDPAEKEDDAKASKSKNKTGKARTAKKAKKSK